MSDLGAPQQPVTPPLPPPGGHRPPLLYGASRPGSKSFLVTMLVIACILLGAVLGWGLKERRERARLTARNHDVEDAYTFVLAKRNDLASFLTDPRTRMIRLEGRGSARGLGLTVAWQDESRTGVVVADSIPLPPDGWGYMLWIVPEGAGPPVRCDPRMGGSPLFTPEAGVTAFEFRALNLDAKAGAFFVTQEQRKDAQGPGKHVVYQSSSDKRV